MTKLKNKNKSKYGDDDGEDIPEEKDEKETTGDDKLEAATPEVTSDASKTSDFSLDSMDLPVRSSHHGYYTDVDADEYAVNRH